MTVTIKPDAFVGPGGSLTIQDNDELSRKIAMLIEGECQKSGPAAAARKFHYSRQRYFQLRAAYKRNGAAALINKPPGPRRNYRRTDEAVCQTIRHRLLDPEAKVEVIAQKLRQVGFAISTRSVERIFEHFGLQKKTLSVSSRPSSAGAGHIPDPEDKTSRARRSLKPGAGGPGTAR
jgi:hypothetical protein